MTRQQFISRTANPSGFVMCNFGSNSELSETDPSYALTGMQIFQASIKGQEIPQPTLLHYVMNGVKVDNISPIDNPNVDYFDGMEYAKSVRKDLTDKWQKVPQELKQEKAKED